MSKKLCIVGTGGCAKEIFYFYLDTIKKITHPLSELVCFMESDENIKEEQIMGINVLAQSKFNPKEYDVIVGVGDSLIRKKITESLPKSTTYRTIIHPTSIVSDFVELGQGTFVGPQCVITTNIKIGKHCILNRSNHIGHDCIIGDFFSAMPGSIVSGNVKIGDRVYLGTNSCIREKIFIQSDVIVGMGGVVVKDILEHGVYVGNPIKKIN
jgi:sugar O-acyltransferase (sialic acid O-acetyltransferase NeuD family)